MFILYILQSIYQRKMFVYHVTGKMFWLNMVAQRWRISLFITYVLVMANRNFLILWLKFRFLERRSQLNNSEILKSRHNNKHFLKLFVTAWNICRNQKWNTWKRKYEGLMVTVGIYKSDLLLWPKKVIILERRIKSKGICLQ